MAISPNTGKVFGCLTTQRDADAMALRLFCLFSFILVGWDTLGRGGVPEAEPGGLLRHPAPLRNPCQGFFCRLLPLPTRVRRLLLPP